MSGQRGKVLGLLRTAGKQGVLTSDFLAVGVPRFSARIEELRDMGYEISTTRIGRSSFRYRLESDPEREKAIALLRAAEAHEDSDGTHLFDPGAPAPLRYGDPEAA